MGEQTQIDMEYESGDERVSSDNTTIYESLDVSSLNIDSARSSYDSYDSFGCRRNTVEVTNRLERLYKATDIILIICGIIIAISVMISLGIFIFGQCRINRGLENYVLSFDN